MPSFRTHGVDYRLAEYAVFVASFGRPTGPGNWNQPFDTITAGIAKAQELGDVPVIILDGETYTEDLTVPSGVSIYAPHATLVGALSMAAGARVHLHAHYAAANSTVMCWKVGVGHGFYRANISDGRGVGGALTGVFNFGNGTEGGVLHTDCQLIYVGESGRGIVDAAETFGHTHFRAGDLYLAGDSAIGINALTAGSSLIGYVDHILEVDSPATTSGIVVADVAATVRLTAGEVTADTAYNVGAAGTLILNCLDINGTETGTATKTAAA